MVITRKAAIGFLLLTAIVFLTAQFTVDQMEFHQQEKPVDIVYTDMNSSLTGHGVFNPAQTVIKYQSPLFALGKHAPLIITAVIDLFTLVCYFVLKKLEPSINKAAQDFAGCCRGSDDQINP